MFVRVLVVDDSRFFRRRVTEMLEADARIKVIGAAENGIEAVEKAARLKPDVITMDIEMPVMDGITATKKILANQHVSILMFSSLTTDGAKATLDALEAGALDFLPKRFEDISSDREVAKRQLREKVIAVARKHTQQKYARSNTSYTKSGQSTASPGNYRSTGIESLNRATKSVTSFSSRPVVESKVLGTAAISGDTGISTSAKGAALHRGPVNSKKGQFKLVLIGTSTGGPIALQKVLTQLPQDFPAPILLVQHMPGSFTTAFAQRLNAACAIHVKEAEDGDYLMPGVALLAPGGKQMEVQRRAGKFVIRIKEAQPGQNYKPCVDITFSSALSVDPRNTLAIIMTGMGSDGCEGSKLLKSSGATIWAQDELSCVVYGMPAAVVEAGIADYVLSVDDIGLNLAQRV